MKHVSLLIVCLFASSCRSDQDTIRWDEPLLGDETAGGTGLLPLFSPPQNSHGTWPQPKKQLSSRERKHYWTRSPVPDDESHAWKKTLRKRLSSFSRRWVLPPFLSMHRKPSENSEVIGQLLQGDIVFVQSIKEDWARLKSGAFVPAQKLSTVPPDPAFPGHQADDIFEEDLFP